MSTEVSWTLPRKSYTYRLGTCLFPHWRCHDTAAAHVAPAAAATLALRFAINRAAGNKRALDAVASVKSKISKMRGSNASIFKNTCDVDFLSPIVRARDCGGPMRFYSCRKCGSEKKAYQLIERPCKRTPVGVRVKAADFICAYRGKSVAVKYKEYKRAASRKAGRKEKIARHARGLKRKYPASVQRYSCPVVAHE